MKKNHQIREETRHGILAVAFFAATLFFLLSSWNYAGVVGRTSYHWLGEFFGTGFFIIPVILFLLGLSFLKSIKPYFIASRLLSGAFIFLAGLGIIAILVADTEIDGRLNGGLVGRIIAAPLKSLLGIYSLIFLGAVIIIGFLVMFDAELRLPALQRPISSWFSRDKKSLTIVNQAGAETAATNSEPPADESKSVVAEEVVVKDATKTADVKPWSGRRKSSGRFTPPPLELLAQDSGRPSAGDIKANANIIRRTLANFGINVEMDEVSIGPSITRYAFKPAEGVKLSRIVTLQNDLSLALAAHPIRIEAPIPGRSLVGVEIPNNIKSIVGLAPLLGGREFTESPHPLLLALGRSISGAAQFTNLGRAPHILIAGATGSGKSVVIHAFLISLIYRHPPDKARLILIDPKRVELTLYNGIPHLLTPVLTDPKKAILVLKWAAKEMERRYHLLSAAGVRDITSYHKNNVVEDKMPYIIIVLDELADIMATYPRELETAIIRLAQMSRAVGIHLVLSTQRPSVDIITGLIKANIPTRIALQVISQVDSRTILDMSGAEKLLGAGDMLYLAAEMSKPVRLQGAFVSEEEVKQVVKFLKQKYQDEETPTLDPEISLSEAASDWQPDLNLDEVSSEENDEVLYEVARELLIKAGKASASYLQRKLKIGYARAARLLDMLEERGVIGPADGAKQRVVYEKPAVSEEQF